MEGEILIEARHLSRRYGPTIAVADLNLTLRKGEVLGLLGPNGAGKTTTMKMLAGCLAPSAGEVFINGVALKENPKQAKRHLGYLPEHPPLHTEVTVNEYLQFCAGLHGIPRNARNAAIEKAQHSCGLNEVARRTIANLSKGYQQRVGLAQAILHQPPVIILDEPTVGLDPNQIRGIRTLISELGQSHSLIVSSHILPEIQATCSRVMIINRGQVVYSDAITAAGDESFESISVALRRPPEDQALRSIAGIREVKPLGNGRFRLYCNADHDPRDAITETAVANNWGLYELRAEMKTLEEIFVELTSGEELGTEAQAA